MNSQLQHGGSSSLARDQTQAPALKVWSLSHWTTREVPEGSFLKRKLTVKPFLKQASSDLHWLCCYHTRWRWTLSFLFYFFKVNTFFGAGWRGCSPFQTCLWGAAVPWAVGSQKSGSRPGFTICHDHLCVQPSPWAAVSSFQKLGTTPAASQRCHEN